MHNDMGENALVSQVEEILFASTCFVGATTEDRARAVKVVRKAFEDLLTDFDAFSSVARNRAIDIG